MARAGFYAVQATKIRFGGDGRWYADDEPITNPRIAALFTKHLRRQADGRYVIRMGDEQAPVEVDDTAIVVIGLRQTDDGRFFVELNDETSEPLDPTGLEVGAGNVLYCRVKGGSEKARFLRPAYYQLAPHITEHSGGFLLRTGNETYAIRKSGPGD